MEASYNKKVDQKTVMTIKRINFDINFQPYDLTVPPDPFLL